MVGGLLVYADGTHDTITCLYRYHSSDRYQYATVGPQAFTIYVGIDCLTNQTFTTTWTEFTCTLTTGSTITSPTSIYVKQTDTSVPHPLRRR